MRNFKIYPAFSMIEAMMILIGVALFIAALIPSISRKTLNFSDANSTLGGGGHGRYEAYVKEIVSLDNGRIYEKVPNTNSKRVIVYERLASSDSSSNNTVIFKEYNNAAISINGNNTITDASLEYRFPNGKKERIRVTRSYKWVFEDNSYRLVHVDGNFKSDNSGDMDYSKTRIIDNKIATIDGTDDGHTLWRVNTKDGDAIRNVERILWEKMYSSGKTPVIDRRLTDVNGNLCSFDTECRTVFELPVNGRDITVHAVGGGGTGGAPYPKVRTTIDSCSDDDKKNLGATNCIPKNDKTIVGPYASASGRMFMGASGNPYDYRNSTQVANLRGLIAAREYLVHKYVSNNTNAYDTYSCIDKTDYSSGAAFLKSSPNSPCTQYSVDSSTHATVARAQDIVLYPKFQAVSFRIRPGSSNNGFPHEILSYTRTLGSKSQPAVTYLMPRWGNVREDIDKIYSPEVPLKPWDHLFKPTVMACAGPGPDIHLKTIHLPGGHAVYKADSNPKGMCYLFTVPYSELTNPLNIKVMTNYPTNISHNLSTWNDFSKYTSYKSPLSCVDNYTCTTDSCTNLEDQKRLYCLTDEKGSIVNCPVYLDDKGNASECRGNESGYNTKTPIDCFSAPFISPVEIIGLRNNVKIFFNQSSLPKPGWCHGTDLPRSIYCNTPGGVSTGSVLANVKFDGSAPSWYNNYSPSAKATAGVIPQAKDSYFYLYGDTSAQIPRLSGYGLSSLEKYEKSGENLVAKPITANLGNERYSFCSDNGLDFNLMYPGVGSDPSKMYNEEFRWIYPFALKWLGYGDAGHPGQYVKSVIPKVSQSGTRLVVVIGRGGDWGTVNANYNSTNNQPLDLNVSGKALHEDETSGRSGSATIVKLIYPDKPNTADTIITASGGKGGQGSLETDKYTVCYAGDSSNPSEYEDYSKGFRHDIPTSPTASNIPMCGGDQYCCESADIKSTDEIRSTASIPSEFDFSASLIKNSNAIGIGAGRSGAGIGTLGTERNAKTESLKGPALIYNSSPGTLKYYNSVLINPKLTALGYSFPWYYDLAVRERNNILHDSFKVSSGSDKQLFEWSKYNTFKVPSPLDLKGGDGAVVLTW